VGEYSVAIAQGAISFYLKDNGMMDKIKTGGAKTMKEIMAVMEFYAPQVEAYAKNNAPWQDRTSNARNGLAAQSFKESNNVGIVLYHQVPYGIWLEVKNSGRFEIINPTIDHYGPIVLGKLGRVMDRTRY